MARFATLTLMFLGSFIHIGCGKSVKPIPPEYRVLAKNLGQEMKSAPTDFRDNKDIAEIIAEGHAAVMDLQGIRSADPDITYIATAGHEAYADAVSRLKTLNALPKPQATGSLLIESFIHGLYGNIFAGYALGVDADNKQKAINAEIEGLIAAVDKAHAAHLLLPRIAQKHAAPLSKAPSQVVVLLNLPCAHVRFPHPGFATQEHSVEHRAAERPVCNASTCPWKGG